MAKYQTKSKSQKVYAKNRASETIIPANCVAVFPMLIVSGSTYITENGIMPQNKVYDKGSFLFWQEVFDGRSSIKIQWEDAITLEKPLEKNYYLADTKVGKYYYGKPISSGTESLEIGEDESFDEFITMKANQTVKIRFEFTKSNRIMLDNLKEDLRFVDNDLYKLYLIPELCEGKLMYISDYEEGYEDKSGLSYWCEITFQTLGSELQKSGKAVEQYPQWSAPGEFYVKPKIEYSVGNVREKRITIDQKGLHPIGIKHLQVELQGPALTSCVYALGRRQEKDEETGKWKIGPSHHLLGYRFITTQPNPLNRTSTPTKNYDCFINEEVVMSSTKEMFEELDKFSQPLEQMKNGGVISLGAVSEWGGSLVDGLTGIHISNKPSDNIGHEGNRFDYFDNSWLPLKNFTFGTEQEPLDYKDYDTSGCVYAEETMRYTKNDTMIDIMNKNVFTFNQQPIVPLSMYASRPLYLKNIPIIGSIANFFSLGDIHLFTNTINRQASNLIFFGDADLCSICSNLQKGYLTDTWIPWRTNEQKVAFPINFFGNNQTSYNKLGVNSVNSTFCIELTDIIGLKPHNDPAEQEVFYKTLYLGQSTDEEGTPFFPDEPDRTLLVNGTLKAKKSDLLGNEEGYIIDAVIVQTIFDGKIRLSAYTMDDDEMLIPAWSTTILSNANWQGGAMRDWTNMYLLSNWTDRFCRQQDDFTYPKNPHKQNDEEVIVDCGLSDTYQLSTQGTAVVFDRFTDEWTNLTNGYKDIHDTTYTQRNKQIEGSTSIQYIALGIEGVDDKESFKEYFGDIQANFQQSNITYSSERFGEQSITTQKQFKTIGSIGSADTYTFELPILSINNPVEGWENLEIPSHREEWNLGYLEVIPPFTEEAFESIGPMATTLKPVITIELQEEQIVITMVDKSLALTWSRDETNKRPIFGGGDIFNWVSFRYGIILNSIKFRKKGINEPFPNSIYGLKQTKTPVKSTGKKK